MHLTRTGKPKIPTRYPAETKPQSVFVGFSPTVGPLTKIMFQRGAQGSIFSDDIEFARRTFVTVKQWSTGLWDTVKSSLRARRTALAFWHTEQASTGRAVRRRDAQTHTQNKKMSYPFCLGGNDRHTHNDSSRRTHKTHLQAQQDTQHPHERNKRHVPASLAKAARNGRKTAQEGRRRKTSALSAAKEKKRPTREPTKYTPIHPAFLRGCVLLSSEGNHFLSFFTVCPQCRLRMHASTPQHRDNDLKTWNPQARRCSGSTWPRRARPHAVEEDPREFGASLWKGGVQPASEPSRMARPVETVPALRHVPTCRQEGGKSRTLYFTPQYDHPQGKRTVGLTE